MAGSQQRWWTPRAILLHLATIVWVAGCAIATWWQVGRAASGNQFSYLYAIEWPVFAGAGAFCWWALVHTDPASPEQRAQRARELERVRMAAASRRDRGAEDPELSAYNDHLAALAASGRRKAWRR